MMDHLPNLVFQFLVMSGVALILWQIDTAKIVDKLRHASNGGYRGLFVVRRLAMFLKALCLCWAVYYSSTRGWTPWPPFLLFLAAFDSYVIVHILIMRRDIERLRNGQEHIPI